MRETLVGSLMSTSKFLSLAICVLVSKATRSGVNALVCSASSNASASALSWIKQRVSILAKTEVRMALSCAPTIFDQLKLNAET